MIVEGMTPSLFVASLNDSFIDSFGVGGFSTITIDMSMVDVIDAINQNFSKSNVFIGQKGLSFANTINANFIEKGYKSPTNYYVKNGGDDSNDGLTDATAWANHPWMSTFGKASPLVSGDIVFMKCGSSWSIDNPTVNYMTISRGGRLGSPITTTFYSEGDKPLIKINTATTKDVVYALGKGFIDFIGIHVQHHSNIFTISRNAFSLVNCHDFNFRDNEIDNIPGIGIFGYGNCYNISIGNKSATSKATSESYSNHIHHFGYGAVILEGVNPASDDSQFDFYHNYIHDCSRSVAFDNAYGIMFTAGGTSVNWPKNATSRYNFIEGITTWEGMDSHGGRNLTFSDNYVKNFGTRGVIVHNDTVGSLVPVSDDVNIERNIFEQPQSGWTEGDECSFITQYGLKNNPVATRVLIKDNECLYTARPATGSFFGIRIGNIDGISVYRNKMYNGSTASGRAAIYITIQANPMYGNKNAVIEKNFVKEWGTGIECEGSCITGRVVIKNNLILNPPLSPCFKINQYGDTLPSGADLKLLNNNFIGGTNIIELKKGISLGGSMIAKNNIMGWTSQTDGYYWDITESIAGQLTIDYNIYWNSSKAKPFRINGVEKTFAEWQSMGYDTHSSIADPLFINAGGLYALDTDFQIQSESPAINNGIIDIEVTDDYFDNTRVGNPDIGINEY